MKYLGIDYGTKKIGVAVSDDTGSVAFPKEVFPQGDTLLERLKRLIEAEQVSRVVIGESLNEEGAQNPLMESIKRFAEELRAATSLPIYFEPEHFTSVEARKVQPVRHMADASAAALILQRFLDKEKENR